MTIKGRVAIVTGSGSGIGETAIVKLAENGAKVVVHDINGEAAEKVAEKIKQAGGEAIAFQGDVTKWADAEKLAAATVEKYGRIDILVNNAGVLRDNYILKMPEEDFDFVINVNLKGVWLTSKAILKYMKDQKYGRIVNISSRAYLGNPGQSNYSSSKAGVVALTRVLAMEFGRFGITVNAVAPGLIDTPLTRGIRPDVLERLIKSIPTQKMGTTEDIANAILFFAADESSFITGQTLLVDGGRTLGMSGL